MRIIVYTCSIQIKHMTIQYGLLVFIIALMNYSVYATAPSSDYLLALSCSLKAYSLFPYPFLFRDHSGSYHL